MESKYWPNERFQSPGRDMARTILTGVVKTLIAVGAVLLIFGLFIVLLIFSADDMGTSPEGNAPGARTGRSPRGSAARSVTGDPRAGRIDRSETYGNSGRR
jgi:hypothetical protein